MPRYYISLFTNFQLKYLIIIEKKPKKLSGVTQFYGTYFTVYMKCNSFKEMPNTHR